MIRFDNNEKFLRNRSNHTFDNAIFIRLHIIQFMLDKNKRSTEAKKCMCSKENFTLI